MISEKYLAYSDEYKPQMIMLLILCGIFGLIVMWSKNIGGHRGLVIDCISFALFLVAGALIGLSSRIMSTFTADSKSVTFKRLFYPTITIRYPEIKEMKVRYVYKEKSGRYRTNRFYVEVLEIKTYASPTTIEALMDVDPLVYRRITEMHNSGMIPPGVLTHLKLYIEKQMAGDKEG